MQLVRHRDEQLVGHRHLVQRAALGHQGRDRRAAPAQAQGHPGRGNWTALAAEGQAGNGPITDCIATTSADAACANKLSYWGGSAGRERLLVSRYPTVAAGLDMVNVQSYDARFEHYDGVVGWTQYRNLFPSKTIVSIGLETSPEGWTGANLVVNDADAQCDGSRILQDQYGATLNAPYSVARYTGAVAASTSPNRNARDGAMLWNILKAATGNCGTAALASPGTIGKKAAQTLGVVDDPLLQQAEWK